MHAMILCGGRATRLGEITKELPKILLDIGGRTILEYQAAMLKEAGVTEIFLASGHLHDVLQEHVGHEILGMPVHYVQEKEKLGTGGAIKNALAVMTEYPIFVLNGDILLDSRLSEMSAMLTPEMDALLLGVEVPDASSFGRLVTEEGTGRINAFVEKDPNHTGSGLINGGVYLLNKSFNNFFPEEKAFSVEYDVFPNVEHLFAFHYKGTWIDIGTPERLDYARNYLPSHFHKDA